MTKYHDDNFPGQWFELVRAECCRPWPLLAGMRFGRCGYCNEYPVIVGPWEERAA